MKPILEYLYNKKGVIKNLNWNWDCPYISEKEFYQAAQNALDDCIHYSSYKSKWELINGILLEFDKYPSVTSLKTNGTLFKSFRGFMGGQLYSRLNLNRTCTSNVLDYIIKNKEQIFKKLSAM